MPKFKLIKIYPGYRKLGLIIEERIPYGFMSGSEYVGNDNLIHTNLTKSDIESSPDFWKKIK